MVNTARLWTPLVFRSEFNHHTYRRKVMLADLTLTRLVDIIYRLFPLGYIMFLYDINTFYHTSLKISARRPHRTPHHK